MKDQVRKGTQELSVERDGAMVSVSELVQDELKAVVRDWPIWAALFECVEDGRIVVRDGEEVYQNQDEFLAPYLEAVKTLEAFVQKAIRDAIPATLDAIAVKASSAGASLAPFLGTAARKRIEEKHGPKVTGLYDRLCDAAEPARLAAKVLDDPAPAAPPGAASAVPATGKADTAEPHPGASDDAGLLRAILEGRPALPDARSQFPLALEKTFSWSRSKPCRQPGADHQFDDPGAPGCLRRQPRAGVPPGHAADRQDRVRADARGAPRRPHRPGHGDEQPGTSPDRRRIVGRPDAAADRLAAAVARAEKGATPPA